MKRLRPLVEKINALEAELQALPDVALRQKTAAWKEELSKIEDKAELARRLGEILPEAFAVVKNACRRLWGKEIIVRGDPSQLTAGHALTEHSRAKRHEHHKAGSERGLDHHERRPREREHLETETQAAEHQARDPAAAPRQAPPGWQGPERVGRRRDARPSRRQGERFPPATASSLPTAG